MDKPHVTIIVPFYNVEDYLSQCLESIFSIQTEHYEVLLINDGSTDRSGQIASSFLQQYPQRCRLIEQDNQGIACARNTGLDNARGDWIIYVDSDDFIEPQAMQKVFDYLHTFEADVLVYDAYKYVNGTGKLLEMSRQPNPFLNQGVQLGSVYIKELAKRGILSFVTVWDKAYRRSSLTNSKARFIPQRIHEDVAFIFQLFLSDIQVEFVDVKAVYYRISRQGSIMTDYSRAKLNHVIQNIIFLQSMFKQKKVSDTVLLDYLVFLAGTVVKGGVKVPVGLLWSLFLNPISPRKRVVLAALFLRNLARL